MANGHNPYQLREPMNAETLAEANREANSMVEDFVAKVREWRTKYHGLSPEVLESRYAFVKITAAALGVNLEQTSERAKPEPPRYASVFADATTERSGSGGTGVREGAK
jgi:hypothetical protein